MVQRYQIGAYGTSSTKIGWHSMVLNKLTYKALALRMALDRVTPNFRLAV